MCHYVLIGVYEKFEHVGAMLDNLEGIFSTYEQEDMAKSYAMWRM
jgi:hypothetical protein